MNELYVKKIASELNIQPRQVAATAKLFAEGATVPFISRYRKEATGSLDEVAITTIRERLLGLADLDQRRDAIVKSLTERNLLTAELTAALTGADTVTRLEDSTRSLHGTLKRVKEIVIPRRREWCWRT